MSHRSPPTLRAQKFPRATSFSMSTSRARSTTIFLSLAFSFSRDFSLATSSGRMAWYWAFHRWLGLGRDLQPSEHLGERRPSGQQTLGLTELADDLLGRVPLAFHERHLLPSSGGCDSHTRWTISLGAGQRPSGRSGSSCALVFTPEKWRR